MKLRGPGESPAAVMICARRSRPQRRHRRQARNEGHRWLDQRAKRERVAAVAFAFQNDEAATSACKKFPDQRHFDDRFTVMSMKAPLPPWLRSMAGRGVASSCSRATKDSQSTDPAIPGRTNGQGVVRHACARPRASCSARRRPFGRAVAIIWILERSLAMLDSRPADISD